MRAALLISVLAACESSSAVPVAYITRVAPSSWDLDRPESSLAVTGHGFIRDIRVDLIQDADPNTTLGFSGTLGGRPLTNVTWISNELLLVTPPPGLSVGTHELTVTTPRGSQALLRDAVRIFAGIDLPRLTVNTTADENDISDTPLPGTEGARMSLREALLIANFLAAETYAIDFDPELFPLEAPGVITVTAGPQPLPPITHPGIVIDGYGTGVEISGAGGTIGHGLTVRADDVWVRDVTIRDFIDGRCVDVAQANRVRLSDNLFLRCDRMTNSRGAQVKIDGGAEHELLDNRVLDGGRDGLYLNDAPPADVLIQGNTVTGSGDDGVSVTGRGHILRANEILENGGSGVEAGTSQDIVAIHNIFRDNGDGLLAPGEWEHGIDIGSVSRNWQIVDNEFTRSDGSGVRLGASVAQVTIRQCDFFDNGVAPILGGRSPPTIDSFNGAAITGTSTSPGTIELFAVDETTRSYRFVLAVPSSGAWSATLDPPLAAVAATLTTNDGTTQMSQVHTP